MQTKIKRSLAYLRDRVVNAYWMIRERRFRQVWHSLLFELRSRKKQISSGLAASPATPLEQSGGSNPCKPADHSLRPATSRLRVRAVKTVADPGVLAKVLDDMQAQENTGVDEG